MPLRTSSPRLPELQQKIRVHENNRFLELVFTAKVDDSRYLHWDQLSRRTPPNGWSHEEWWFALKMRRQSQMRRLPLRDKNGDGFGVNLTDEVLQLSEEIARRAGGMLGGGKDELNDATSDLYLVRSLVEESIRSSQLEGASTSRRVAVEMIESGRRPQSVSELMILNNYLAMREAKEAAQGPLTPETVLAWHRTLTMGTLDDPSQSGRLQTAADERVSVWADQVCVHLPPPATELPDRLNELCRFANGTPDDTPYLPPVVRAIITHFMFGYDHYFEDGNGRTARTAFYWSMLHNGYWIAEFATISAILRQAPGQYGDAYQYTEDDEGDLTYFVLHQLRVFKRALDELDEYIAHKREENSRVRRALSSASGLLNFRQAQMIEALSEGQENAITARRVASRYLVSEQTARNDLRYLEGLGLLARLPRSRPVIWVPIGDFADKLKELGFG